MNYISTLAWLPEGEKRQNHLDYLLTATKDVVDLFAEKFLKLWDEVVTDEMAKTPGFKEWYLEDVLVNTAGVAGCEMIRRSVGFAHVKDLDSIPDDTLREKALKTNILLAKHLIKNRHEFTTGAAYQKVVKEITLD